MHRRKRYHTQKVIDKGRRFPSSLSYDKSETSPQPTIGEIQSQLQSNGSAGPDLYSLMTAYLPDLKIGLKIPPTLVKEHNSPPVLFFTDGKGQIVRLRGPK